MAANRDLSKFANHIFNHDDGHIGLSTDINVRLGIGTNTPRAKLDVDGDLRVSGIATFKDRVFFDNDIVISGSAEYTGVSTFSDADVSDLIVTNITVRNKAEINSLNVGLNQITYEGTLSGVSTNIIGNTLTTDIEVGYEVSGNNIDSNTTVAGIGSSAITLSRSSTNNIVSLEKGGIFESTNGDVIVGINTSDIVVGYGISNKYVTQGNTGSSVDIS